MVGREGSGEVEAVLWKHDGELYVGVGSDHTDRKLETVGITLSKQVCAKPVSTTIWPWREVSAHWDELLLRSSLPATGEVYQEGAVSGLRRPDELLAEAMRVEARKDGGMTVPGKRVWLFAEALRALAREKSRRERPRRKRPRIFSNQSSLV